MARRRSILLAPLRVALDRHARGTPEDVDHWAEAVLDLAHVNAGASALVTLFRITATTASAPDALIRLAATAKAAADVCRRAGSTAARACLDTRSDLAPRLLRATTGPEALWWRGLVRAASDAPDCVAALAVSSERILAACGTEGFEGFVAAGLRSGGTDKAHRFAFFTLEAPEARRVLDRLGGQVTFEKVQGRLNAYAAALWGRSFAMRESTPSAEDTMPRRTTVSSGIVLVPDTFKGIPKAIAPSLYKATIAHATAHLMLGGPPFEIGKLKPLQAVLTGLVEDARIEALAMRRFPGLRHLWAPFHVAEPSPLKTAPAIMERMARALFDPAYVDEDGIVSKARALFNAEPDWDDPGLSRRIGGLIGNDIGQMRIQFSPKLYVVEPVYRDDNLGLWTLPTPPPNAMLDNIDLIVQSARIERDKGDARDSLGDPHAQHPDERVGRARSVAPDDRGVAVASYPEWDRAAGSERPDWTTVREVESEWGSSHRLDQALARDPGLRLRIARLVRAARVGRPTRLRRQPDGLDLDLDAAIDAATALRIGELPDERIHLRKVLRTRDLAVLVLIDTSESTRDRVPAANAPVLDVETTAVAVLAEAMDALGDRFALRAFCSNGRDEVRIVRVKDFDQPFNADAKSRLAGLKPRYSTRLGAALRHAGAELGPLAATRRIVIALTDGAPSDIDIIDQDELVEDARRAVLALHHQGIDVFGITLDPSEQGAGATVFGRSNHMPVRRIEELPSRMSELYFRIARR